jgi:hypothetical protein
MFWLATARGTCASPRKVVLIGAMDGSMQELKPADGDEGRSAPWPWPGPREMLTIFTAGWLGGAGLLTLFGPHMALSYRMMGASEAVAAALWFVPRLRLAGFGAMLAVLAIGVLRDLAGGERPGALVFYAAVVAYLAYEERRGKTGA